ncbi:hypothetical protein SCLCIDRAFT_1222389, partial [Scleroderma citrinum Foug A]
MKIPLQGRSLRNPRFHKTADGKPSQKWRMDSCGTEVSDKASSCVYTFSGIVAEQLAYMLRSSELPDKPPRSYLGPRDPGTPRSLAHIQKWLGPKLGPSKPVPEKKECKV